VSGREILITCGPANGPNVVDQVAHRKENVYSDNVGDRSQVRVPQRDLVDRDAGRGDPAHPKHREQRNASCVAIPSDPAQEALKRFERVGHKPDRMNTPLRIAENRVEKETDKQKRSGRS
jgi:hypothetical protein